MNNELNKFITETADLVCKTMEREVEQNLLTSIIDIYENNYTFKEYTDKLYKYNKEVQAHNYKLSIMDSRPSIEQYMAEIPVLSHENFMFIRSMKKGNR